MILDTLARVGRTLRTFVEDHDARLRYGLRNRAALHKKVKAGEDTNQSYRVLWLNMTVSRVISVMREAGEEFNARYPWDAISHEDQKDVARTLLIRLEHDE